MLARFFSVLEERMTGSLTQIVTYVKCIGPALTTYHANQKATKMNKWYIHFEASLAL
jgi:hypothetical protein